MRISDWSSDVCSSDLNVVRQGAPDVEGKASVGRGDVAPRVIAVTLPQEGFDHVPELDLVFREVVDHFMHAPFEPDTPFHSTSPRRGRRPSQRKARVKSTEEGRGGKGVVR